MSATLQNNVTGLLVKWRAGDPDALNNLIPLVYRELRKLARRSMLNERRSHTLQHTALVNEAYLKLIQMDISWKDRAHFFAVAARSMRRILVDHARAKAGPKRGGGMERVTMSNVAAAAGAPGVDILDLDSALLKLAELDSRRAEILELHYFGGLTHEEVAAVLAVSPTTVDRELRFAKAWITRELRR